MDGKLILIIVVGTAALLVVRHFINKAVDKTYDAIDNKLRERENREKGPIVESLSDKYGIKQESEAAEDNNM